MYSFVNDYSETGHPAVLAAIAATATATSTGTGLPQVSGYGTDAMHSARAAALIREHIGKSADEADVHFVVGGTQANLIAISLVLRSWEAVISTNYGHIAVHETGAIEVGGHKVLIADAEDGKLTPALIEGVLRQHSSEHMVVPRLVYISNSTEIGTQYTKSELQALSTFCKSHNLLLFLDGARLGSALTSSVNDLTMKDIADLTDAFYIGGTKNGAMFGEALVFCSPEFRTPSARHAIKQRGALLAKGWLISVQFEALFTDKLFYSAGEHANHCAMILKTAVKECGYELLAESFTNQLFVRFPSTIVTALQRHFALSIQSEPMNGEQLVRLCTSWGTSEEQCHHFAKVLKNLTGSR